MSASGWPWPARINGSQASEFAWLQDRLGDRIECVGYQPEEQYRGLLLDSDVVVSAADHEFFGIAIVEAIAAGAVPVLPDRLSFPELIEPRWRDATLYQDGDLRGSLRSALGAIETARAQTVGLRESMERFDAKLAATAHDEAVDDLLAGNHR